MWLSELKRQVAQCAATATVVRTVSTFGLKTDVNNNTSTIGRLSAQLRSCSDKWDDGQHILKPGCATATVLVPNSELYY